MQTRLIPLILFLIMHGLGLKAQDSYKNIYPLHLRAQISTYFIESDTTEGGPGIVEFSIRDAKHKPLPAVLINLHSISSDTVLLTSKQGSASLISKYDSLRFSITCLNFSPLEHLIVSSKPGRRSKISVCLAATNALRPGRIESKRILTPSEIETITEDLSKGKEDSPLIKDKTCKIVWEL
jgi:hypothetical protein